MLLSMLEKVFSRFKDPEPSRAPVIHFMRIPTLEPEYLGNSGNLFQLQGLGSDVMPGDIIEALDSSVRLKVYAATPDGIKHVVLMGGEWN
jgi:hypothetical protein